MKKEIPFLLLVIFFPVLLVVLYITPFQWDTYIGYEIGDASAILQLTRAVMDHGYFYFSNDSLGYPFGIDWHYAPTVYLSYMIGVKFFSIFTDNPATVVTLIFIYSFVITSIVTYVVFRKLGLSNIISFLGAQFYTFIPYHFITTAHILLSFYFICAIALFYAVKLVSEEDYIEEIFSSKKNIAIHSIILILSMQEHVYFIFYFILVVGMALLVYISNHYKELFNIKDVKTKFKWLKLLFIPSIIFVGAIISWLPFIVYSIDNANINTTQVHYRNVVDSEIFAGKLTELLYPNVGHRLESFREFTNNYYNKVSPHEKTESLRSSLGLISSIIFIFSIFFLFKLFNLHKEKLNKKLSFLSALNYFVFLWFTIGGLGSIFSLFIWPAYRAWNRISVVISIICIAMLCFIIQYLYDKYAITKRRKIIYTVSIIFIMIIGLLDQIPRNTYRVNYTVLQNNIKFYNQLQDIVKEGAVVYQYPFAKYPVPATGNLYELYEAYAFAPKLKYNIGTNNGSIRSNFYELLNELPIKEQVTILDNLDFNVILVYKDYIKEDWEHTYKVLVECLGNPILVDGLGRIYAFKVPDKFEYKDITKINNLEDIHNLFVFNKTLELPINIDLSAKGKYDLSVTKFGFSVPEPNATWTDANLRENAKLKFLYYLPQIFELQIKCIGILDNAVNTHKIIIGNKSYDFKCSGFENYTTLTIETSGTDNSIEIKPFKTYIPYVEGISSDGRNLGIMVSEIVINDIRENKK